MKSGLLIGSLLVMFVVAFGSARFFAKRSRVRFEAIRPFVLMALAAEFMLLAIYEHRFAFIFISLLFEFWSITLLRKKTAPTVAPTVR
jgi:hypothetical protein